MLVCVVICNMCLSLSLLFEDELLLQGSFESFAIAELVKE